MALPAIAWRAQAACATCDTFQSGVVWGSTAVNALTEASGIAVSRRNDGVLWVHNDGSRGRAYAFRYSGELLAAFDFKNNVEDLEDIAVGPGPVAGTNYLYIGDIGGNVGTNTARDTVKILRIPEPAVDSAWGTDPRSLNFKDVDAFTLTYPDGSYDAEALMVDPVAGDVVIVTKQPTFSRVYRANLNGAAPGSTVALEFIVSVQFSNPSAGDISPDGTQILLRRESAAAIWSRCDDEAISAALGRAGEPVPVIGPPTEPNGEGIAFLSGNLGYVTISEGEDSPIYLFKTGCATPPGFIARPQSASVFAGGMVSFEGLALGFPTPILRWRFNGQPLVGQTGPTLQLSNVTLAMNGNYDLQVSNASGAASAPFTLTVRTKPDVRITEVESSPLTATGVETGDWWELTSFESQPVSLAGWRFNDSSGDLADAFLIGSGVVIQPGESMIFAESLTAAQFRTWWGAGNVPASVTVIRYTGSGLSLSASGDAIRLWNDTTTDTNDLVTSASFGTATAGVSFNFDPITAQFGGLSQIGNFGVFRATNPGDVGSPGRIRAPANPPFISVRPMADLLRLTVNAVAAHQYTLEVRTDVALDTWTALGEPVLATTDGPLTFEVERSGTQRFFQITVK